KTFDQVICTGVLHHLPDPAAGLRAPRSVLERQGAVHLMVYAPYGRSGTYMLQEVCRRVGFCAPEGEIRALPAAPQALPATHPLTRLLQEAPDFRSEAGLADALLHPQDRAYSVPQLLEFLRANGLTFGRWLRQAPYSLQAGLMSQIPRALRAGQLPLDDLYAAAQLCRGSMMRHDVIAYRYDKPEVLWIRFDDDSWLGYIPIRAPDTVTIRERFPAGCAAIFSTRALSHTDICLPIRAEEMQLHGAI